MHSEPVYTCGISRRGFVDEIVNSKNESIKKFTCRVPLYLCTRRVNSVIGDPSQASHPLASAEVKPPT